MRAIADHIEHEPEGPVQPIDPPEPHKPRLLDAKQAAEFLGFSVPWIRKKCRTDKTFPVHHVGRNVRFDVDELKTWVKGQNGGGR